MVVEILVLETIFSRQIVRDEPRRMVNGRKAGMAGMAESQKEWQNGRMAEMDTYVLFMVHADTDDDT